MAAILADDIFERIFVNENVRIAIQISLKFVPNGPIANKSALVQIMAMHRLGDKSFTWSNDDPVYRRICVAPAGDEVKEHHGVRSESLVVVVVVEVMPWSHTFRSSLFQDY